MTTSAYQAVILAAGRGARLSERTGALPKALLPIGPRALNDPTETSFLRRQAELLRELGVAQVVVVVGYRREQVQAALVAWGDWGGGIQTVVNPADPITASGSLDSFDHAARSELGVLDGARQTLIMDADIVYHRDALRLLLEAPARTTMLVSARCGHDDEEVLVYGSPAAPRFLGKGLTPALVGGAPCLGEAVGIVKLAPADHDLARQLTRWLLGFGPARRATEHEELSQRLMQLGRMRCLVLGQELPFMEVDSAAEYAELRERFYPRLLRLEAGL